MARSDRAVITACTTRRTEDALAFAREFNVAHPCSSVDELVGNPDVDAVFIATPNDQHHDAVVAAARAGKHVLCEKPLALSMTEAEDMVNECRKAGVVLRIGLQLRLEEIVAHIRQLVLAGAIGTPLHLDIERTSALNQPGTWRRDRSKGGSILYDTGVHLLDLTQWILGDSFRTLFALGTSSVPGSQTEDSLTLTAQTRQGCQTVIRISREAPFGNDELTIVGTAGVLRTGPLRLVSEHTLSVRTAAGVSQRSFAPTNLYAREIDAFADDVLDGGVRLPTDSDALRSVIVTLAAVQSLDTGQAVRIEAQDPGRTV
jgi:1,5-anhydro-D-fructose reductase (1,5-anhydro-D-mannitol-forming)